MAQIQTFDPSLDLMRAVLWQYDDAPNLIALLQAKQDWYEIHQTQFWNDWHTDVFDLKTANNFGLSVWSIILQLPLFSSYGEAKEVDAPAWGFGQYNENFYDSNFLYSSDAVATLTTEEIRSILRLRYYQLTSDGCVPSINAALHDVFSAGTVYVRDNLNMTCTYVFTYPISTTFKTQLVDLDVLPRPAGVSVSVEVL